MTLVKFHATQPLMFSRAPGPWTQRAGPGSSSRTPPPLPSSIEPADSRLHLSRGLFQRAEDDPRDLRHAVGAAVTDSTGDPVCHGPTPAGLTPLCAPRITMSSVRLALHGKPAPSLGGGVAHAPVTASIARLLWGEQSIFIYVFIVLCLRLEAKGTIR